MKTFKITRLHNFLQSSKVFAVCAAVSFMLMNSGTGNACRLYGIISDHDLPARLMYNNLVADYNKVKTFGALVYGGQRHGWGIAQYNSLGANLSDNNLLFFRDIDKPAECSWDRDTDGNYTFTGCTGYDEDFVNMANNLDDVKPRVVLAHWRTGSSGCSGADYVNVHPFYQDYDGKTWSFVQNGGVDKPRTKWLIVDGNPDQEDNDWTANLPTGSGVVGCTSDRNIDPFGDEIGNMVDSELYFKLVLKQIREAEEKGGTVVDGIVQATTRLINHFETGGINFIMTDGYTMWGFKRGNRLSYRYNAEEGFCDIATNQLTGYKLAQDWMNSEPPVTDWSDDPVETGFNNEGWTDLEEYQLVVCEPGAEPLVYDVRDLIPGNFDGDTDVDEDDYQLLIEALKSRPRACVEDSDMDLDGNGRLTGRDKRLWTRSYKSFTRSLLCDDHLNKALGCCREGYLYGDYDIICDATYLPLDGAIGSVELRNDLDYFIFPALANVQYTLSASSTDDSTVYVSLYDQDGKTELLADDTGSSKSWFPAETGLYFAKAYVHRKSWSDPSTGDYSLDLTMHDAIEVDVKFFFSRGKAYQKNMWNKKWKNPTKRHSLFVALLSSKATCFDATQLDPETFLINGSVVSNKKLKLTKIDVNGDGLLDLVIKVDNAKDLFVSGENDAEVIGVANGIPFYGSNVVTR